MKVPIAAKWSLSGYGPVGRGKPETDGYLLLPAGSIPLMRLAPDIFLE